MPGIEPPVVYAWWVPVLGALLLALALAWLLWLALRARGARRERPRGATTSRTDWRGAVAGLHARFLAGELDLRGLHLGLAALVRAFGADRTGLALTTMTRAEVEVALPGSGFGQLLARFEQPSFARDPHIEAQESVDGTLEVLGRW